MQQQGINLHFSHSVEKLSEVLADKVLSQQTQQGVFQPVSVLVPNSNMQRYLQLQLAQINGVCANLSFPFLETGLFQWLCHLHHVEFTHLSGGQLTIKIWDILKNKPEAPEFALIQNYLISNQAPSLQAAKTFQLSQKIAMLLLDYESQRPEMIAAWMSNNLFFKNSKDAHLIQLEQTQMALYQQLLIDNSEAAEQTLLQAFQRLKSQVLEPSNHEIHIFTPSRISQLHRQIISYLAHHIRVNIYQLDVCLEYWEDMQTKEEINWQEQRFKAIKNQSIVLQDKHGVVVENKDEQEIFESIITLEDENPLLKAWGKPGREALKLFSELELDAAHFNLYFNESRLETPGLSSASMLAEVQHNILYRLDNTESISEISELSTVQLAVAPSVHREVEAVYNSILWNLKQDENLMLHEVAVLVADMNTYRFVIEQVFEQLNRHLDTQLAYSIVDGKAETESSYATAVMGLMTLLEDDFIRSSVFSWLDNPCVQAANQMTQTDWQDWLNVVNELGIYCGYDHLYPANGEKESSHRFDNQTKLYTWEQGLKRLRKTLAIDDDATAVVDVLNAESIGQLSHLLASLHEYRVILSQTQSAAQWESQLNQIFDSLIAIPVEHGREQMVQMALQQSLHALTQSAPDLQLSYEDIKQYIQHEIKQIPANKGNYLSGGVVCASLQPMRPIPFKMTYILGLDDKQFPGQFRKDTLDLTQRSRRIGDISSIENKNYLFLETLMCTRNKLYLSYVGTNLATNEIIEPSPVLVTLRDYCFSLLNPSLNLTEYPVIQLPLYSDANNGFDQKNLSHQDIQVNFSYLDYLTNQIHQSGSTPEPVNLKQQHWMEVYQSLNTPLINLTDEPTTTEQAVIDIDINDLVAYLTNPQTAILKRQGLNLKHEEDFSMVEQEPMTLAPLEKHQLFVHAVNAWLKEGKSFDVELQQRYQDALRDSQVPLPPFADLKDFAESEEKLMAELKPHLEQKKYLGEIKIGHAESSQTPAIKIPAISIQIDNGQTVNIHGVAEHLYMQNGLITDQLMISSSKKNTEWNVKLLKPFIQWCLWQISTEIDVAESLTVHLVFPGKIISKVLRPWIGDGVSFATKSTITDYLKGIISDYLNLKEGCFLPFEMANSLKVDNKGFEAQNIKLQAATSKAKDNSFFAYPADLLTADDLKLIQTSYQEKAQWPEYDEISQLFELNLSPQAADDYRRLLLPLYAMVFGKFTGDDGDLS